MKVVHHNAEAVSDNDDLLERAGELEKSSEWSKAASLYLRYLRKVPGSEYAFGRLMIIYRKQKEPDKEIEIINRGIKTFEDIFRKSIKVPPTKKTVEISKKLMKAMGLTDRKGKELFEREPLKKWKKRKALLEKRLEGRKAK